MDCYDSNQEDAYGKNGKKIVGPAQVNFPTWEGRIYPPQEGVGTKPVAKAGASGISCDPTLSFAADPSLAKSNKADHRMKYSNKVHAAAWQTIASAIIGLSLSGIGAALHSEQVGLLSVLSIAICGIALMRWIESARCERQSH